MVSGLDLTLASDHNPEVEFKLISGTGPVIFFLNQNMKIFFFVLNYIENIAFF